MNRASRAILIGLGFVAVPLAVTVLATPAFAQNAEITLFFVNPANPGLLIANETETEAKDIRYEIGLWNADNLREGYKVLPIPGSGLEYLPPHRSYGPINLLDEPEVRPWLRPGDRIVGNIAVNCRNCARGYTYWVLITWGEGGWYSEIKDKTNGALVAPRDEWDTKVVRDYVLRDTLLGAAAEVKQENRIPIAPYTPPPPDRN